jgi:acetyl esterase/lipase
VALAPGCELAGAAMLVIDDPRAVGLAIAIGAGFEAAYPDANLSAILTPKALALLEVVDRACIEDVVEAFSMPVEEVVRLEAILQPPWPALLEENTPGRVATAAPIFIGQGDADVVVSPLLTDALVERLCAAGDDVTYRRYAGANHEGVGEAAIDDVRRWVGERLAAAGVYAADDAA